VPKQGALLALEDANRGGRVKYEFVYADDAVEAGHGDDRGAPG